MVEIRKAISSDNDAARGLVRVSLAAFGIEADFDGLDHAVGQLGATNSTNVIELVAVIEGTVAGCVAVERIAQRSAKLFGFHVDGKQHGRGIGRALLSAAIAETAALGIEHLHLDTCDNMAAAIHLYESFGWQRKPDPHADSGADRSYVLSLL